MSTSPVYSGVVGEYHFLPEEPPTSPEWQDLHHQATGCGFRRLGFMEFSFAPSVTLSVYTNGETVFTIMGRSSAKTLTPAEYECFTELDGGGSITTTTTQKVNTDPARGIHKRPLGRVPLSTLLEQHNSHIRQLGKPADRDLNTLLDVAKSIDRFLAYEQGIGRPDDIDASGAELDMPFDPAEHPRAVELARLWSTDEGQYFVLNVRPHADEPAAWGLFALDLMKHAARAYERLDGRPKDETYKTYKRILAGFMAEMQNPTEPL